MTPECAAGHLTSPDSWDNGQGWSQDHLKTPLVHLVDSLLFLFFLLFLHSLPALVFCIPVIYSLLPCLCVLLSAADAVLLLSFLILPKGMDPGSAPGRTAHPALGWAEG